MASLTIVVPDAEVPRIRAAFAVKAYNRRNSLSGGTPDPEDTVTPATPEEIRQGLIAYLKAEVKAYESGLAAAAAVSGISEIPAS